MMGHGQNGVILLAILLKKEKCNIEKIILLYKKSYRMKFKKLSFFFILLSMQTSTILYSKDY